MENEEEQSVDQEMKKRVFAGGWFLVIAPIFVCFIRVWYSISSDHMLDNGENLFVLLFTNKDLLTIIIWTIGGAIGYYFASLVPKRVLIARERKQEQNDEPGFFSILFKDSFKGGIVKTDVYDASGGFLREEEYYVPGVFVGLVGVPLKIVFVIVFLFVKAALVPYWAIFNFFRNYVLLWIFPKKFI